MIFADFAVELDSAIESSQRKRIEWALTIPSRAENNSSTLTTLWHPMASVTHFESHCGLYAFFHEGKYYVFIDDENGKNQHCGRVDIVQILEEGGTELLNTLRTVFDFVETGVSTCDGGDSSAIVRNNPNPEWEKAFAKACLYFTRKNFPAFFKLELADVGFDGRLISCTMDKSFDFMYAIDLDNNLFHERGSTLYSNSLVASHPIQGLTKEILDKLRNQNDVEDGFFSQSFPLPNEYKQAILDDLSIQGYRFCCKVTNSYDPILWRVKKKRPAVNVVSTSFYHRSPNSLFFTPLHERHMAVTELLTNSKPHPHLIRVLKTLILHGNPAVVVDAYDSDLETAREKLSRKQMNSVIAQVVKGIIYLHQHGVVHHDIKPSNILVNYNVEKNDLETEGVNGSCEGIVEAVIYDFRSVSIPSARHQKQENNEQFSWGPFSHPPSRETPKRNLQCDDRWIPGWAPMKTSIRFLRRDFRTANPWTIDCSSVAMMFLMNNIEIYRAYQESSVSDYRDHPQFSVFFNVVNLFQSHARSAQGAIQELEATFRTLSDMDLGTIEGQK
eukprot:CAMPEP_0116077880 /NCGR_PEP_ID=MMETSP0327-20121206/301_1 /TAXON_ID=44447 /ORGANISM="Pseudo-nitzschia delicatissima, Strain B596" /LENGTH=556 /DNA_ID=CAMNT_0003568381 /DNA_START=956 /DNA_END=2627 /DNA_ORIENTATION=-